MASSLVSWIGPADLSASEEALETGQLAPIASHPGMLEACYPDGSVVIGSFKNGGAVPFDPLAKA